MQAIEDTLSTVIMCPVVLVCGEMMMEIYRSSRELQWGMGASGSIGALIFDLRSVPHLFWYVATRSSQIFVSLVCS